MAPVPSPTKHEDITDDSVEKVMSREIRIEPAKRRKGSYFAVGGLTRKTRTVAYEVKKKGKENASPSTSLSGAQDRKVVPGGEGKRPDSPALPPARTRRASVAVSTGAGTLATGTGTGIGTSMSTGSTGRRASIAVGHPAPAPKSPKSPKRGVGGALAVLEPIQTPVEIVDNSQPIDPLYCDVCRIRLANSAKMAAHIRFSTLHELELAMLQQRNTTKLKIEPVVLEDEDISEPPQLIYRGSKFIIKASIVLDVYIYQNAMTENRPYMRLGIICYNVDDEEEYPPIHLNGDIVQARAKSDQEHNKLAQEVNVVVAIDNSATVNSHSMTEPHGSRDFVKNESLPPVIFNKSVGEYIMKRITYQSKTVTITRHPSDTEDPPIVTGPAILPGVKIEHKKIISTESFRRVNKNLEDETKLATQARQRAEGLATQARRSIDAYQERYTIPMGKPSAAGVNRLSLLDRGRVTSKMMLERIGSKISSSIASSLFKLVGGNSNSNSNTSTNSPTMATAKATTNTNAIATANDATAVSETAAVIGDASPSSPASIP